MKRILSAPINVDLCITQRCNMHCKHCFAATQTQTEPEPALNQLKFIIGRLTEAKVFLVTVTGGEPLVREDFFDIISYIRQYPLRIGLNTNAALVTDEISRKIAKSGFKSRISVSLDGASQETFEMLRGPGTFTASIKGLQNLLCYNKNIRPFCVVTQYNFTQLEEIIKLAKSLGAPCLEFNYLLRGERAACYQELFLNDRQKNEALEKIIKLEKIYGNYIGGSFVYMAKKSQSLRRAQDAELLQMKGGRLQNCDAGFGMCAIRADGKVTPCYTMLDFVVGDLLKDPLKEIWKNSTLLKEFRSMHEVSLDTIEPCKTCIYKGVCNAGCRAGAYYHSQKTRLDMYDPEGCYLFLREVKS